jgi:hypothetical protein
LNVASDVMNEEINGTKFSSAERLSRDHAISSYATPRGLCAVMRLLVSMATDTC